MPAERRLSSRCHLSSSLMPIDRSINQSIDQHGGLFAHRLKMESMASFFYEHVQVSMNDFK